MTLLIRHTLEVVYEEVEVGSNGSKCRDLQKFSSMSFRCSNDPRSSLALLHPSNHRDLSLMGSTEQSLWRRCFQAASIVIQIVSPPGVKFHALTCQSQFTQSIIVRTDAVLLVQLPW